MQEQFTPEQIKRFEERFKQETAGNLSTPGVQVEHIGSYSQGVPEGIPHAVWYDKEKGVGGEVGPVSRFGLGMGAGVRELGAKLANLLSERRMPEERLQQIQEEDKPFTQTRAGSIGKFVGETAALGPLTEAIPALPFVNRIAYPMAKQAITGGAIGGLTGEPGDRLTSAAYGAAFAPAPTALGKVYQSATRGMEMSPSARNLVNRRVDLTPGQLNPESTWGMIEEALLRVPGAGPRVAEARNQGWEQTRNLIGKESAPPGYEIPNRADPADMYKDLKAAYTDAYGKLDGYKIKPILMQEKGGDIPIDQAVKVKTAADKKSKNYVQNTINNEFSRYEDKQLYSQDLLDIRSNLRAQAEKMAGSDNYPDAEKLFRNAVKDITNVLESQLPPKAMAELKAIDAKYGNFKILENALNRGREQGFTPSQFSQSVYGGTQSESEYAAGGGRMRDISKASADVFNPRQPATGASQPSQLLGYAVAAPTALFYGKGQAGQIARALLTGQLPFQQGARAIERQIKRQLSPSERKAIVDYLSAGSALYGAEEQPYFATTK